MKIPKTQFLRALKKKEIYLMAVNVRNSLNIARFNETRKRVELRCHYGGITMSFATRVFLVEIYKLILQRAGWGELF